jgi:aminoglycoside adenylyltransferase-like protein
VSVPLEQLPEVARHAWTRLRKELLAILGEDLIAIWAYGGTTAVDRPPRSADLDTHVIVRRSLDTRTAQAIEDIQAAIAGQIGVEWDAWYVLEEDARRPEAPRHAYLANRRDTSWAINRAYWLAGRYARVYGRDPAELVPPPTWSEVEVDLHRELEHLERHVAEGDTDPDEAIYAFLNGSRILHAVETGDVAISKRSAGKWALEHLPVRWHAVLGAAGRAYDGQASSDDADLLAREMAPFVAIVRERLPTATPGSDEEQPRWSGH